MTIDIRTVELFDECKSLIDERGKTHGPIEETYKIIAGLWSIRVGVSIMPSDVCDMIEDMKWVRSKNKPNNHDNCTDGVNYKAFAYLLRERGL